MVANRRFGTKVLGLNYAFDFYLYDLIRCLDFLTYNIEMIVDYLEFSWALNDIILIRASFLSLHPNFIKKSQVVAHRMEEGLLW